MIFFIRIAWLIDAKYGHLLRIHHYANEGNEGICRLESTRFQKFRDCPIFLDHGCADAGGSGWMASISTYKRPIFVGIDWFG
jgi:hypothetical protein